MILDKVLSLYIEYYNRFIYFYDFLSRPFGEPWHSMGLATAYGPFLPAVYHPFVLREAGWAPQKGLPKHGLLKESMISQRIVRRDGGPVQGRRPYTQPSRQPNAGGNAQSKGPSSRPRRARCCKFAGSVSMKFGE